VRGTTSVKHAIMSGRTLALGLAFLLSACTGASPSRSTGGAGGDAGESGSGGQTGGRPGTGGANGGTGGATGGSPGTGGSQPAGPDAGMDAARMDAGKMDAGKSDAAPTADAPPAADLGSTLDGGRLPAPPAMWMEHWFEHVQNLKLVAYNDDVAIYFDDDTQGADWIFPFMTKLWRYTKATYDMGPEAQNRLFSIHHTGKYGGGHPSTYFDTSHDRRNVSDVGPGPWGSMSGFAIDGPSHESGHVVESANNGVHGSPAFPLWQDSKWMEFFQYDAYVGMGMTADAKRLFDTFTATTDGFPRAGTHWFRDWFYPLWRDHGHAQVMVKFFKLLATHFPKNGNSYSRDMNWGEFVHFMSGAAGTDLKELATTAFGWPAERDAQFNKARADFPMITY
jgi:hypothetical protein